MLKRLFATCLPLWLVACGAAATGAPPQTPGSATSATPEGAPPGEAPKKVTGLGALPTGVPAPDKACAAYAGPAPAACAPGDFTERLASALSADAGERDGLLRCLEADKGAAPGVIRALRAELAPRGCGDVVVGDEATVEGAPRDLADTLVALGLGARLYRTVREPPLPRAPFDKAAFLKHSNEVLGPWVKQQWEAVDALSKHGRRLEGYAKGIVALEAGLAYMRFVGATRTVALPEEMKSDPEIRETYLVGLEAALERYVKDGRDAALVGLGELSKQGITNDARLREVRQLLSELYAGRRLDALDKLLLPSLPPPDSSTAALKVAAKLPAFYALKLAASPNVDDAKLLRARLEQGVPPALWLGAPLPGQNPELAALSQRGLFQLGQVYFWAEPFQRAAAWQVPATDQNAALLTALAKVLAKGPRNAAAMMLGPPTLPAELRDSSALDGLAKATSPIAGFAEFDAAYLRGLAPPQNDPAFWKEQAKRFSSAQKKLADKAQKGTAAELAKAATDTEKELSKQAKVKP